MKVGIREVIKSLRDPPLQAAPPKLADGASAYPPYEI
jgi:hypothetical protein